MLGDYKNKILLIGGFNSTTQDIQNCLSEYFDVQLCDNDPDPANRMIDFVKPSLVVYSLVGDDGNSRNIFVRLDMNIHIKKVVVIGNIPETYNYREFLEKDRYAVLHRPAKRLDILSAVCDALDIDIKSIDVKRKPDPSGIRKLYKPSEKAEYTIMIVDDSKVLLRSMNQWLSKYYKLELADSAEMAFKKLEKDIPDLILLDYDMPGMNGKEFFEKMSDMEPYKDIPVVFLTAVDRRNQVMEALKLFPVRYILKPVDHDELLGVIDSVFNDEDVV